MPLDNRKLAHLQTMLAKTWEGRQKTVVFVYNSAGTYSYVAQSVILRFRRVIDPQIPGMSGQAPGVPVDAVLIAAISISFTGIVLIADTATATSGAVATAAKYQIIERVPTGMAPASTRYVVSLRRLR